VEAEQTVEELLADVKLQYDLHGETLQRAQGQRATLEEARDTVTQAVDKLIEQVRDGAEKIKHVCADFNLAHELAISVRQVACRAPTTRLPLCAIQSRANPSPSSLPPTVCVCQLKTERGLLTNLAAIDAADRFIGAIEGVVDALQREKGAAPRARPGGRGAVAASTR
jgi:predicted RNase H-like HicB family nuclease